MGANKERQQEEAEVRLKALKLHPNVLKEFKKSRTLYYSEQTRLGGILYWVKNDPKLVKIVKEFEEETGNLVYHMIHSYTNIGEMYTFLYVSPEEDDWEYDRRDLIANGKMMYPTAYVHNITYPDCSEYGAVQVREAAGGLIRVH